MSRIPNAAEKLRADYKEGCEHHTIVDLMRNDLSRIAEGVHVRRFKYLTELHTSSGPLLQMSSEVVGSVDRSKGLRLGDLILQLLPAGSISGAPKSGLSRSSKRQKAILAASTQASAVTSMAQAWTPPSSSASSRRMLRERTSIARAVASLSIASQRTNTANACRRSTFPSSGHRLTELHRDLYAPWWRAHRW